jgi:hypothetical protein
MTELGDHGLGLGRRSKGPRENGHIKAWKIKRPNVLLAAH